MLITKCVRFGSSVMANPIHQLGIKKNHQYFRLYLLSVNKSITKGQCISVRTSRHMASKPFASANEQPKQQSTESSRKPVVPSEYRFVYPEFLPDPKIEWRNLVKEKLERADMLNRRYLFILYI